MTCNIEYRPCWPEVRRVIQAQDLDVVCLQEVPTDQSSLIRTDLGPAHEFQLLPLLHPRRLGNMTLARSQIKHGEMLQTALSRAYGFTSLVKVGPIDLTVANVQLSSLRGSPLWIFPAAEVLYLWKVIDLTQRFLQHTGPVVAAGAFNTFSGTKPSSSRSNIARSASARMD